MSTTGRRPPDDVIARHRAVKYVSHVLVENRCSDIGHDALVGQPVPPPRPNLRASHRLAILLNDLVRIPGTKQGVGLDALLGLVPGFGDYRLSVCSLV